MTNYIRFDWAMKRLLRNKANHSVIEGLLTSLFGQKVTILKFLESESNQETEDDKFNRVDILAENDKQELIIVEIQNTRELAYFHRMLYGVSKAITDYIGLGDEYDKVRKVYSVNIVYFELGQGKDYVYHGKTIFQGLHDPSDVLKLSVRQNEQFFGRKEKDVLKRKDAGDLFPEYYVLRVNDFDKVAKTPLDEWISYLKNGEIPDDSTAPGLERARECMRFDELPAAERRAYLRHMEAVRTQKSVLGTSRDEGFQEGLKEGRAEGLAKGLAEGIEKGIEKGIMQERAQMILSMSKGGLDIPNIVRITKLPQALVEKIINDFDT